MHQVSMVGDAGRVAGYTVGQRVRRSGCVMAVVAAALLLGACAREDTPTANWQTTTQSPMSFAPSAEPPAMGGQPPGFSGPMAPSVQTLPPVPAAPAERNPCLTKWGSPRLDAPEGCASRGPRAERDLPRRGVYKVGKPYTVAGKTYVPAEDPNYDETGTASWYGDGFHGGPTANGEVYDMHKLTAAHKTLPMPSYAYVHNPANGRTIMVRINNRGPFKGDRIIDLSQEAARLLDVKGRGLATVRVTYAGPAPLDGDDSAERAFLAQQAWYKPEIQVGAR
jgi:rare lipoprotein A (peptidoglycan hydrolase)